MRLGRPHKLIAYWGTYVINRCSRQVLKPQPYLLRKILRKTLKLTLKQKAQLNRPRPFLFLMIVGVFSLPWLLLFRNGVRSRHQQTEMATHSATFFAQIDTYQRNASAEQFDRLGADLGFLPNDPRDLVFQVDPEAKAAYGAIEDSLDAFLKAQASKSSGPLDSLPSALSLYLASSQPKLTALRSHILQGPPPQWEIDIEQMSAQNYPFAGLVNTANTQKLLLLSAIDYQSRNQPDQMQLALEASWQLNQTITQRPDLVSQVSASAISSYQAGILRHLNDVPAQWQGRLKQQVEQQSVVSGLEFDVWLQYTVLSKLLSPVISGTSSGSSAQSSVSLSAKLPRQLSSTLSYWFSPVHYFNLTNIDTAKTAHRALNRLHNLDVCSTTQQQAEDLLAKEETARWNEAIAPVPAVLARRWKVMGDRALALELTQKVLQAKQLSQSTAQPTAAQPPKKWPNEWPNEWPDLTSQACPGEHWVYERTANNTITLSFSTQVIPEPAIPLHYESSQ